MTYHCRLFDSFQGHVIPQTTDSLHPAGEFPISFGRTGQVLSRYGDVVWDLSPHYLRYMSLRFEPNEGSPTENSQANAKLARRIVFFWMYGRSRSITVSTLVGKYHAIKALIAICDREDLSLSEVAGNGAFLRSLQRSLPELTKRTLVPILREIQANSSRIGFSILDYSDIATLKISERDYSIQSAYIPERIYGHVIDRCLELLHDYQTYREDIEHVFRDYLGAYCDRSKRLRIADGSLPDFSTERFVRFYSLVEKWLGTSEAFSDGSGYWRTKDITQLLNSVRFAAITLLIAFSGMRKQEASTLRSGCLTVERDPALGSVYLIKGTTTKTMHQNETYWVTSDHATRIVEVLESITAMRLLASPNKHKKIRARTNAQPPLLFSRVTEPWALAKHRGLDTDIPPRLTMSEWPSRTPHLFDLATLKITNDDLKIARRLSPNLQRDKYAVGNVWPLTFHQLRRTLNCNAASSGLVSLPSLQYQMKHQHRSMTEYYGRRHSKLAISESMRRDYAEAVVDGIVGAIRQLEDGEFISPLGAQHKLRMLEFATTKDLAKLQELARLGKVGLRENALGLCMRTDFCPYGGYDNLAHCVQCHESLFRRSRAASAAKQLELVNAEISKAETERGELYLESLRAQRNSLEGFLHVIAST